MGMPSKLRFLNGAVPRTIIASIASYILIWLWVDVTRTTYYYVPFLFVIMLLHLGLDIKLELKLKRSLIPMRNLTSRYALPISLGSLFANLAWGLRTEEIILLTIPLALIVGALMQRAFCVRYSRLSKMIGS